jgi:hypothetical protein
MRGQTIGVSSFTMEDAKRAGLSGGDNWKKYPRNMLFARAMSNGAKWYCPDVFGGPVYTPDELEPRAKFDPESDEMVLPPVVEAEVVEPEESASAGDLHAEVAALVSETGTDLSKLLAHYGVADIKDLSPDQAAEAIKVLTVRKSAAQVSFP